MRELSILAELSEDEFLFTDGCDDCPVSVFEVGVSGSFSPSCLCKLLMIAARWMACFPEPGGLPRERLGISSMRARALAPARLRVEGRPRLGFCGGSGSASGSGEGCFGGGSTLFSSTLSSSSELVSEEEEEESDFSNSKSRDSGSWVVIVVEEGAGESK